MRNFSKHAVHDVSITVLPWRCAAGSMGPASAPSPEPLPSLSSGLRVLPAAGAGGTIQAVVGVSELLGFRDPHGHHDAAYEHSRQRLTIGAPRARCVYCCCTVYLCSFDGHSSVILKERCCQQELQRAEYCVSAPVGDVARQCRRSGICYEYGAGRNQQSSRRCSWCRARPCRPGRGAASAARGSVQHGLHSSGTRYETSA